MLLDVLDEEMVHDEGGGLDVPPRVPARHAAGWHGLAGSGGTRWTSDTQGGVMWTRQYAACLQAVNLSDGRMPTSAERMTTRSATANENAIRPASRLGRSRLRIHAEPATEGGQGRRRAAPLEFIDGCEHGHVRLQRRELSEEQGQRAVARERGCK